VWRTKKKEVDLCYVLRFVVFFMMLVAQGLLIF